MGATKWPVEQFYENGIAVIEDFYNENEVAELYKASVGLCYDISSEHGGIFQASGSTKVGPQLEDKYFLESGNKIYFFYEADALDESGNLRVEKTKALNKVGHALHTLHPIFNKYTFNDRIRNIANQVGLRKPLIPQSMCIYKNPKIGGEVKPHQDASYLHTEPNSIVGFWIPLEDATIENGCLWFIKGSHKNGLTRRLIRNPDQSSNTLLIYDKPLPAYLDNEFTACPVRKGSLVLIHGFVVHKSELNKSNKSRHAYTFHVMESDNVKYSKDNWLQLPEGEDFPAL